MSRKAGLMLWRNEIDASMRRHVTIRESGAAHHLPSGISRRVTGEIRE
jgi:hypothetical protein